jgi:hypothetical protein
VLFPTMFLPKRPPLTRLFNSLNSLNIRYQRNITSATTVNADEIAHFSRLSEHWWDEEGEFAMLHKMNPVRAGFIRDRVIRTREDDGLLGTRGLEGLNALDIGCGGGLLSEVKCSKFPIINVCSLLKLEFSSFRGQDIGYRRCRREHTNCKSACSKRSHVTLGRWTLRKSVNLSKSYFS